MAIDRILCGSFSAYYLLSKTFQCDGKISQTNMRFVEMSTYLLATKLLGRIRTLGRLRLVEFPYPCFHFLARLEAHEIPWWDVDDIARSRISGNPTISSFDLKHAKIPKLDPALFDECVYEGIEGGLNRFLSFHLRKV